MEKDWIDFSAEEIDLLKIGFPVCFANPAVHQPHAEGWIVSQIDQECIWCTPQSTQAGNQGRKAPCQSFRSL